MSKCSDINQQTLLLYVDSSINMKELVHKLQNFFEADN
jgi:hypothetical protein